MRIGVFGDLAFFPGLNAIPWVQLNTNDSLIGRFSKIIFYSPDKDNSAPVDSWYEAAQYFLSNNVPIFWCVNEHKRWREKIELFLLDSGVAVVNPDLTQDNIMESLNDFLFKGDLIETSGVYSIRFDSSLNPEELIVINYLSKLDDPDEWIKLLVHNHVIKLIEE